MNQCTQFFFLQAMQTRLLGKTVLIFGGSSGMGKFTFFYVWIELQSLLILKLYFREGCWSSSFAIWRHPASDREIH